MVNGFGKQIARADRHRVHFAKYGLGAKDAHGRGDDPKMWTLKSLMKANGECCGMARCEMGFLPF